MAAALLVLLPACSSGDGASDAAGTEASGTEAPSTEASGTGDSAGSEAANGGAAGTELAAQLSGDAEVPGPGADGGSGSATVTPDPQAEQLCFAIALEGVEDASAAHVHEGTADVAGPVVVPLEAPAEGSAEGCVQAEASVLESIAADPASFYVNVHNAEFPDGAVRGQLEG